MISRKLVSFVIVGAVGFIVDYAVVMALVTLGVSALLAQVPAFLLAVLATFMINRKTTFVESATDRPTAGEAGGYLAIQGAGAATNYLAYGMCLAMLPQSPWRILIALAIGAVFGLVVNYLLLSRIIYWRRRA